ncbi:MAG TPA: amino acid adenylation domain-containing protein [Pyrinomonadaceae bacterium]|jgi:amino acid adenylation domain-containing protein
MTNKISDLIELLRERAARQPERTAYTFLDGDGAEEANLTYAGLERRARAVAARLQAGGFAGQRVLLLYPPGLEYITAFWGCLYAGAVAVPAYPPRQNRSLDRLQAVAADAQSTLALTSSALLAKVDAFNARCEGLSRLSWLATETVPDEMASQWRRPAVGGDDLAFLQYTSGSTSAPKGVMVTHGNLLENERMIQEAFRQTEESVVVGWLPLYHDMGLIGNVLQPIYVGARCVLMSPVSFLQDPSRWLSAISRYRGTTSGGPNFAYDLCVRKVGPEQRAQLDLSSWEVAFNGAEPVRAETMTAFAEAFAPSGFRAEAFRPCYGLAEATLLVSSEAGESGPPPVKTVAAEALRDNRAEELPAGTAGALSLVSCGEAPTGQGVGVFSPETFEECAGGEVGEVCVWGPNVTKGYWNRPEETARVFQTHPTAGAFLRTGDLGVVLGGKLFVTGRLKDLIIIRGRNHYPQDIELTVERSHAALRPGGGAAFTVEVDGEERLVVAQEVNVRRGLDDPDEVVRAVTEAVAEAHELQLHAVVLVKAGSIPKTSSGKIRRSACREQFLSQTLDAVSLWQATPAAVSETTTDAPDARDADSIAAWLRTEVAARLGVRASEIDAARPLSDYALDSLAAIELTHRIESQLGVRLPMASLLQSPSINELAAQAAEAAPAVSTALATATETEHPLSRGQQALWFLYRLAPDNAAYNISTAVRVTSALDVAALRRALRLLVERHPLLRSTFGVSNDAPVQRVLDGAELSFEVIDAEGLGEDELGVLLTEEAARRFDLEAGPVFRVRLFQRPAEGHVVLLVVHHIVADFWSLSVLAHELGVLYAAEVSGSQAALPDPQLGYADYVRRTEQALGGPEGERLWSYWRERLAGELPALNLPFDRARPPVQTYRGGSEAFRLSADVTRGLKELSREQGATLYMTLLAAFQTLLYRYTGQEDILVGSPTAGRPQHDLSGVVGYFTNPVVLRGSPSGSRPFTTFLAETRESVLAAFRHQDFPFPLLVERLQPEREASRSPLFQVMFVLQKAHLQGGEGLAALALGESGARVRLGELELESVALAQRVSQFDLTLAMVESGDALSASLQYNTDLFDAQTVRRMAEHLQTLLAGVAARPARTLSELPMLGQAESRLILSDWNRTGADYPRGLCLHQLFEQQAERTPEATALVYGDERLTYAELDARANRLAHRLRDLGAGPEVFVGLLLRRRTELVVALLAVLKSGGSYLPLEPTYPTERLRFMLRDTGAGVLVTEEELLGLADELLAPEEGEAQATNATNAAPLVVCLERDREAVALMPATAPRPAAVAPNMAYVIFTSGSTGRPKGVIINHSSAVIMAQWAGEYFTREQLRGVLFSTSVCFDLSVFELFAPFSVGGTVILAENALELPTLAAASEVTLVNTVPSAMAELVRGGDVPPNVTTVNLAGEALPRELVEQLYALGTVKEVVNLYGPSEDTTYSTFALIRPGEGCAPAIGRPLANTQAYVLDAHMRPVPAGVTGELYLGGEGLSRGYWRRPALTAEKFVPDPFSGEAGARLYRTGDLVRYKAGGVLDYLGRVDHQVKVRGFRIELGEIETALRQSELVREASVVVSDAGGEKSLVAFLVMDAAEQAEAVRELRAWMRERVPSYMVPQFFVTLDALPLTPNGKVDRKSLVALAARERAGAGGELKEPRTQTEAAVAEVWRDVLGVERLGVEDNFFELGGHSLLATRLVSRMLQRFGVEISLRSFFEAPTVEGLARVVEAALKSAPVSTAPPIVPAPRDGNPPLSFAQQRLWFIAQLEPGNTAYNMPAAVRLTGGLDVGALEQSLTEVVRRHEALRTVFVTQDEEPTQVIQPARPVLVTLEDLSGLADDEREAEAARLATAEARKPFDLGRGPLIRFTLLRLGRDEHMLLLTVHHIVFDGWSIGVLIRELSELYKSYTGGGTAALAELPVQYADYAVWQRGWLKGAELERQLAYWRERLAHAPEALSLPTDWPRPAVLGADGASCSLRLPQPLVASLKTLGQQEGATLFMVLLAGLQVLLSRYAGQEDVPVGAAVSNRNRAEVEGLIGFFVNMLVMRGDLSGAPTFREFLGRVREVALEAYAHQDVPFELLVESLQAGRSLNRAPLFQVAFVLQNVPTSELELAGVKLRPVEVDAGRAQFDLSLSLTETEDGGVAGTITYNTALFGAATAERIGRHLAALLGAAAARPDVPVAELTFLSAAERSDLLVARNRTARSYPLDTPLHALFEEQAARAPGHTALVAGAGHVTYGELNTRANRLARLLRERGVGAESVVGLHLPRSVEAVVALLAVLKAGAACVSLDPEFTPEQLGFILADARPALVLTDETLLAPLPGAAETLCLESAREALARQSQENLSRAVAAHNLAWVNYASTSDGRLRGAMLPHRGLVNRVSWMQESRGLRPDDRMLFKSPLNSDESAAELFWPLCFGAQVVVAAADDGALAACAGEHGVTGLAFTPTALWDFAAEDGAADCRNVRLVVCAGAPLGAGALAELRRVLPDAEVFQTYGPPEASGAAAGRVCDEAEAVERGASPLGAAAGNTRAYVLDAHMRPVPAGVTGELYVGGDGLARGYVNQPELTTERFVPDTLSGEAGARLYKTGDLARYGAGGLLEYVGRAEQRIRFGGQQVNLWEAEDALRTHARVREAVVMMAEGEGGERLVAFVVARGQQTPTEAELRAWTRERVPSYTVPQLFVTLERLPLTPDGKVDRRALAELAARERSGGARPVQAPRTETEAAVAEVWRGVLGIERVSVEENFFELGGHSLLATRLVSRLRQRLGVEVGLRSFFESPTVEGLARLVEAARQTKAAPNAPSIRRASRENYRTNVPPQGALTLPEALRKQASQQ